MDTTREQIIRDRSRREKRERWAHIRKLILSHSEHVWLDFWADHSPDNKWDMGYIFGRDGASLRRHVKIELHYLRQPIERQEQWESVIWGE